jgi:hypothetical protein
VVEERAITGARGARDRLLKKKMEGKKISSQSVSYGGIFRHESRVQRNYFRHESHVQRITTI